MTEGFLSRFSYDGILIARIRLLYIICLSFHVLSRCRNGGFLVAARSSGATLCCWDRPPDLRITTSINFVL